MNNKIGKLGIKDSKHLVLFLKQLIVIFFITIVAQFLNLAYTSFVNGENFVKILLPSFFFLSLTTIPAVGLGLLLGNQIGLGAKILADLINKKAGTFKRMLQDARISSLLGLAMGIILIVIRVITREYLPAEIHSFGHRGFIGGLLVSIGAAVGEEVWFRLGLMTLLLWLVKKIFKQQEIQPKAAWTVIILVAIGFGLAHLPQLQSYGAGSPIAIWATILGNSAVGILYGWCYWRKSLLAAMVAHFAVDFVIHALPAFIS